jgi:threonine dehydrogenase-like Zn-dependent dehydrogenase
MIRRIIVGALLVMSVLSLGVIGALAQDAGTKRVGLVIAYSEDEEHLEIVEVPVAATTFDVLEAADIELASESTDFGPAICSIDAVGCPADNCFCDPAHFWAYYHLDAETETWAAALEGVGGFVPADGAVEGLAWSGFDESFNPTVQPPVYTFDQIERETMPEPVAIPEPATLLLVATGLAGLAGYARMRSRRGV